MMNPLMRCGGHIEEMLRDRPEFARRAARAGRSAPPAGRKSASPTRMSPIACPSSSPAAWPSASPWPRRSPAIPELLIADEPSTALDVTTQAEIMRLLQRVQASRGMSLILITHDLRLAFSTCDRIHVLYAGALLEVGAASEVERDPLHPYTLGLLLSEPPATRRVTAADRHPRRRAQGRRCRWHLPFCRALRLGERQMPRRHARRWSSSRPAGLAPVFRRDEIAGEMRALRHRALDDGSADYGPAGDASAIVRITGLVKTFAGRGGRPVRALKGVSIEVAPGRASASSANPARARPRSAAASSGWRRRAPAASRSTASQAADFARLAARDRTRLRRSNPDGLPGSLFDPEPEAQRAALPVRSDPCRRCGGGRPTGLVGTADPGLAGARSACPATYADAPPVLALRRRAPARGHRPGAGRQSADPGLRRAGLGPRRLRPGADPEPVQAAAGRARPLLPLHHPRPRRGAPGGRAASMCSISARSSSMARRRRS